MANEVKDNLSGMLGMNFNVNSLRANAETLQYDEWKQIDDVVNKVYQRRLSGIKDLYQAGLVKKIANGMGKTVHVYQKESEITDAQIDMDGITRSKGDRPVYTTHYLPLPITHKDFQFNARVLAESRGRGQSLDVATAEQAAIKIAEAAEKLLFQGVAPNDVAFTYGGGTIYGYETAPNAVTQSIIGNWDAPATGDNILLDVLGMKQGLIDDRRYGPYNLYIPTAYETALDRQFKAGSDKSIRQVLEDISSIQSIKVSDFLSANTCIMVQMTSDVVQLVEGMTPTTIEWNTEGRMVYHYKLMNILAPLIKSDANSRSGICILS